MNESVHVRGIISVALAIGSKENSVQTRCSAAGVVFQRVFETEKDLDRLRMGNQSAPGQGNTEEKPRGYVSHSFSSAETPGLRRKACLR